jgi:spermidine synthase
MAVELIETGAVGSSTRRERATLGVFTVTIFLSAFLLFSVQPFFAKIVLPKLGGSPAVWSVAMVFFQAMLLAGYAYAHFITTRLSLRNAAAVHLAVMAVALFFLPIAVPAGFSEPPATGQIPWLFMLFAAAVGVPFFAVSANGPLLQAWFSRSGHPHAADPYFLYGASNVGSFASLILYIVLIEPTMAVPAQSLAWATGFVLLGSGIAACAFMALAGGRRSLAAAHHDVDVSTGSSVRPKSDWRLRAKWVGLAAVPSGLLVAVTAQITMDVAAAPFLWVLPLSLFLLTFVIAFARQPIVQVGTLSRILPLMAAMVVLVIVFGLNLPIWLTLTVHLGFFFVAALLAHSVLVSLRPAAEELTGFYFWMSAGGVIGGALVTLASPLVFDWIAEYPLLILAALACRPETWSGSRKELSVHLAAATLFVLVLNYPPIAEQIRSQAGGFYIVMIVGLPLLAIALRYRNETIHAALALAAIGTVFSLNASHADLFNARSFFGVVRVSPSSDGSYTELSHGTTKHGAMLNSERGRKPTPMAYYHESGGIARALFAVQSRLAGRPANMGVVGLGSGAILCHRKPGETWTSYEIDQVIVTAASDPKLFGFVPYCGNGDPILVGDGRLLLAREPAGKFDYLLIDAFSSDSIPVHLLTVEALRLYADKLTADGLVTIHISNRHMELGSVIAALARETDMTGRIGTFSRPKELGESMPVYASNVVVLAKSEKALGTIADDPRWRKLDARQTAPWTDDYSNVIAAILRQH